MNSSDNYKELIEKMAQAYERLLQEAERYEAALKKIKGATKDPAVREIAVKALENG